LIVAWEISSFKFISPAYICIYENFPMEEAVHVTKLTYHTVYIVITADY